MAVSSAARTRFSRLVDLVDAPLCVIDDDGRIVAASAAFGALVASASAMCPGILFASFLSADDSAMFDNWRSGSASGLGPPLALTLHCVDGARCPVLIDLVVVARTTLLALRCIENEARRATAVTDRTLREYHSLLAHAPVGIGFSLNRRIVRYNQHFAEMFGYDDDAGIGRPTSELYPSDEDYAAAGEKAFPLLSKGLPFEAEMRMRRQDGSTFWAHAVAYLVDPADPPQGTIWIISDIDQKKLIQAELDSALLDLTAIFDNAAVGIIFSRNRIIERCNRRGGDIFGYADPAELIGKPGITLYPDAASYERIGREAGPRLAVGEAHVCDWLMARADGGTVWCRLYARAVDATQTDRGTVWIFDDISEARRTRDALQQTVLELEAIMHNASVGVLITRNRQIVRHNPKFADIFGFGDDSAIGLPARVLFRSVDEYAEFGAVAGPLLGAGKPCQQELWLRHQDGGDIWVNLIGYVQNQRRPAEATIWILEDRTAFRRAEEALQRVHDEQQLILDHSVVGIAFIKDRIIQRCNRRMEELYGFAAGELIGQPTRITFSSDELHGLVGKNAYAALARGETFASEVIHRRRNGERFWVRITGRAIDPADPHGGSIWNFEDISSRKLAESALRESEMLQRAILESASLLIVATDPTGRIVSCNPATERLLGWNSEELLGSFPTDRFVSAASVAAHRERLHTEFGIDAQDDIDVLFARSRLGSADEGEWQFSRRDGTVLPVQLTVSPLRGSDAAVAGSLLVADDITERRAAARALERSHEMLEERVRVRTAELEAEMVERRRAEQRLNHLAHHDSLTGLPNRVLLSKRLDQALETSANLGLMAAVLFVDIDRFKNINDSLGHHIGDALLKQLAGRISDVLRAGDTVARIGGDEFVVVLPNLECADDAERVAAKLRDILQSAISVHGYELFATPSIGLSLYPEDGVMGTSLLRNADTAMYSAKAAGRNTIRRFDTSMTVAVEQRFELESSLRHAVARDEFVPYFQPWIDLANGSLAGMEVLVRWQHPALGLLPPARFIPIAEDCGLIVPIGECILRAACAQLRAWDDDGLRLPTLAVNLSPHQFRDRRLVEAIAGISADAGISPGRIELEITETALMQDGEHTLAMLERIKDRGFGLSVDDFGTGYSSLAYLKRFPVDKLKIDQSFVKDMTTNADDDAIVRTIVGLAHTLRLSVTAEGVETGEQRDQLRAIDCNFAQGYFFARPCPAADAADFLSQVEVPEP